ncbi:MAG: winged helix-turn-helix transcriptional regulator [Methanomassiliicoccus sp.]|nr:winged helix-turn-helix transcriptional regulator [Methanomassiliicoccus sp.]
MVRAPKASKETDRDLPDEVTEAISEVGGLDELSSHIPSPKELQRQISIHHALSDKTRLEILWALKYCDLCPCVIKVFLKITDSKLSYHLSALEDAGLVASYPKKNWKIFSITELGRDTLGCGHPLE